MRNIFLITIVLIATFACLIDGQNLKKRNRNRNRKNKNKEGSCHLEAVDACLNKVEQVTNNRTSSILITTPEGISKLCRLVFDAIDCNKAFMKRCSTPLHNQLFDFFTDSVVRSLNQSCSPGRIQDEFLQYSPCIHSRVLSKGDYKTKCVNNFLATLDKTGTVNNIDDRLDTVCCSYNRWEECSYALITNECGSDAKKSMKHFIEHALGEGPSRLCSSSVFNFKSQKCRKLYAPQGSKPRKNSTNPIIKYIAIFLGFLF